MRKYEPSFSEPQEKLSNVSLKFRKKDENIDGHDHIAGALHTLAQLKNKRGTLNEDEKEDIFKNILKDLSEAYKRIDKDRFYSETTKVGESMVKLSEEVLQMNDVPVTESTCRKYLPEGYKSKMTNHIRS